MYFRRRTDTIFFCKEKFTSEEPPMFLKCFQNRSTVCQLKQILLTYLTFSVLIHLFILFGCLFGKRGEDLGHV